MHKKIENKYEWNPDVLEVKILQDKQCYNNSTKAKHYKILTLQIPVCVTD